MKKTTDLGMRHIIKELRALMPHRALPLGESYLLAEKQANYALQLLGQKEPDVNLGWILELPKVEVQLGPRYKMDGLSGFTTDMLQDRYYLGYVEWDGVECQGRHKPLIEQELFDRVQRVLYGDRRAGKRERTHDHYLRGVLWCDRCQHRLMIMTGRSKTRPARPCLTPIRRSRAPRLRSGRLGSLRLCATRCRRGYETLRRRGGRLPRIASPRPHRSDRGMSVHPIKRS